MSLSNAERGLYITACALIYSAGEAIPIAHLRAACRDHGNAFNHQLEVLQRLGKLILRGGFVSNKRAINELENARKRSGNAREKARKRWRNNDEKECDSANNNGLDDDAALLRSNAPARNHQPSTISKKESSVTGVTEAAAPDPVKAAFDRGVAILGGRRSLVGKLVSQYGEVAVLDAIASCEAERPVDAVSFLVACLKRSSPPRENGHVGQRSPVDKLWTGAAQAAENYERRRSGSDLGGEDPRSLLDRR